MQPKSQNATDKANFDSKLGLNRKCPPPKTMVGNRGNRHLGLRVVDSIKQILPFIGEPLAVSPMPSTFAPIGLVLLAAGREPSGFSRYFDHVTGRLAPARYKVDALGRQSPGNLKAGENEQPSEKRPINHQNRCPNDLTIQQGHNRLRKRSASKPIAEPTGKHPIKPKSNDSGD